MVCANSPEWGGRWEWQELAVSCSRAEPTAHLITRQGVSKGKGCKLLIQGLTTDVSFPVLSKLFLVTLDKLTIVVQNYLSGWVKCLQNNFKLLYKQNCCVCLTLYSVSLHLCNKVTQIQIFCWPGTVSFSHGRAILISFHDKYFYIVSKLYVPLVQYLPFSLKLFPLCTLNSR